MLDFNDLFKRNYKLVVSLTIVDKSFSYNSLSKEGNVLVSVRDPLTNLTHPSVVSIPTQRVPNFLADEIVSHSKLIHQEKSTYFFEPNWINSQKRNSHDTSIFIINSILSRKLGLSEALEKNQFNYIASLFAIMVGQSYHPQLSVEHQYENIVMANIAVHVDSGIDKLPDSTASYSHIRWISLQRFLDTVHTKRIDILDIGLDPIEYCIHGLCVWSSYNIFAHILGMDIK